MLMEGTRAGALSLGDGVGGKAAICLNKERANEAEGGAAWDVSALLDKELDVAAETDRDFLNSAGIWGGGLAGGAGDLRT